MIPRHNHDEPFELSQNIDCCTSHKKKKEKKRKPTEYKSHQQEDKKNTHTDTKKNTKRKQKSNWTMKLPNQEQTARHTALWQHPRPLRMMRHPSFSSTRYENETTRGGSNSSVIDGRASPGTMNQTKSDMVLDILEEAIALVSSDPFSDLLGTSCHADDSGTRSSDVDEEATHDPMDKPANGSDKE